MKAAYYVGKGSFEVRDVEVEPPGEGEVSVAVAYCGIVLPVDGGWLSR